MNDNSMFILLTAVMVFFLPFSFVLNVFSMLMTLKTNSSQVSNASILEISILQMHTIFFLWDKIIMCQCVFTAL